MGLRNRLFSEPPTVHRRKHVFWFWFWQIIHSPPRGVSREWGGGALRCVCGRRHPGQLRLERCCSWLFHHMGRKRVPVSYGSNRKRVAEWLCWRTNSTKFKSMFRPSSVSPVVLHPFHRSYLKANEISECKWTRKVEYAYHFWKCGDAVDQKLSKWGLVHGCRNYSLPKLARFFRHSV